VIAWLRRHRYLDEQPLEARSNEQAAQTALDACAAIAMGRGNVTTMSRGGKEDDEGHGADEERPDTPALVIDRDGFNLHAGVRIAAGDDLGRERLLRLRSSPPRCRSNGSGVCPGGAWRTGSSTSPADGAASTA
jgi:hypothetical protein